MTTPSDERVWADAEANTIQEIACRVHPDGAEAVPKFWEWYEADKSKWLGPHRACGAWLYDLVQQMVREAVEEEREQCIADVQGSVVSKTGSASGSLTADIAIKRIRQRGAKHGGE